MKLTPAQITNMGVTRLVTANTLYSQLAADLAQITQHNADANNPKIDPAPYATALSAAGSQIVAPLAAHVAASIAPITPIHS